MHTGPWRRWLPLRHYLGVTGILLGIGIASGCHVNSIMRSGAQEKALLARYREKPFYTAMVVQPYLYGEDYLIDLTGKVTETDAQMFRAPVRIPLGTPITVVDVDANHVITRIQGQARLCRILVQSERGSAEDVTKELSLLLSSEAPLTLARPEMRPYIERQELVRGMSVREIYMSWGQPDKVHGTPGASGVWEQWLYHGRHIHLYLQNGFLTNWEAF